jgi:catechol 2,3-dioxygenase-like lactoylglutathione lyase family enzyme
MKPRITAITICVDDLERSLKFYRNGMGFPTEGIVGTEFEHGAAIVKPAHDTFCEATPAISRPRLPFVGGCLESAMGKSGIGILGMVAVES